MAQQDLSNWMFLAVVQGADAVKPIATIKIGPARSAMLTTVMAVFAVPKLDNGLPDMSKIPDSLKKAATLNDVERIFAEVGGMRLDL